MVPLRVADLFSGCGGMSSGFRNSKRFSIIGAADAQVAKPSAGQGTTSCNDTYEANIGLRPLGIDLSIATPHDIGSHFGFDRGDLDVLIACPPCTGFSQKNAKNHIIDDRRNGLVQRTAFFVEAWSPQYVVMENVKELIQGRHLHHFQFLYNELVRLGYGVSFEVHDLVDFGLPQFRKRTLVIAKKGGLVPIALPRIEKRKTVRDFIGHLPAISAGETASYDPMHCCPNHNALSLERLQAVPRNGGSWIDIPPEKNHLLIPSMNRENPGSFPDIYGRLSWDRPAPAITRECSHPGNGRYTHPEQDRLLSVREMSLLQGFPANYQFIGPLSSRYRQIGDAVPPLVSALIADLILADVDGRNVDFQGHQKAFAFG